jgi:hypothetical protein
LTAGGAFITKFDVRNTAAAKIKRVRFGRDLQARLDRAARTVGISQSEFVRGAVEARCEKVLGASLGERLAAVLGTIRSEGGRARDTGAAMRRLLASRSRSS